MSSATMPTQSGDPISAALQHSLSTKKSKAGEDLDSNLCDKQILQAEIKFEKTRCFNTSILSDLKSKYIVLNTSVSSCSKSDEVTSTKESVSDVINSSPPKKPVPCSKEPTTLPAPKKVLYSPDAVRVGWSGSVPVGSGFANLGNTCYLNSTLQALFHVPAFVNWLLSDTNHSSKCESLNGVTHSGCLICAMAKTLQSSHKCTGAVVKPHQIYDKLKLICKHLTHGHQEDAHEFLRYLLEGMERSYLTIFNGIKLDSYSKETTPLSQIFGGYLRNEVTCLECQYVSTTFQHFQDLLLDIRTASSVEDALETFFLRERLGDGDQAYRCEQCKKRVAATKKFTLERPPKALCIAFKRFGTMGGKNSKTISMKQLLDINKFRHRPGPESCLYKLVSMVSHLGPSSACGHYTAVGFTASGSYYLFDDTLVRPLPIQNVLNSNPYILMYEMVTDNKKQQPMPKKEVLSNGFTNSNGLSTSIVESKTSIPENSISNNSACGSTSLLSSELRPVQNGLSLQYPNKNRPFKHIYLGRPRPENQPGPSSLSRPSSSIDEQPSSSQQKQEINNSLTEGHEQSNNSKQASQQKELTSELDGKRSVSPDKVATSSKKLDIPQSSLSKSQQLLPLSRSLPSPSTSPSKPQPSPPLSKSQSAPSISKSQNFDVTCPEVSPSPKENGKSSLSNSLEKNIKEKVQNSPEDHKSSPSLSLVPYGSDASSESEGEFIPPKTSPTKESSKGGVKSYGRTSPTIQNVKGVRIEIEGWETASNHLPGHNRPDLHSPAGSTSSGKWSVTSAEREKTPEKQEKRLTLVSNNERNDRVPHGVSSNGTKSERWDGSRTNNSTMDHLMKSSHHGYGSQVQTWNGGRSEMDLQVEGERHYLKRSHDSYNDDFDRGKVKKVKYHNKESYSRNRFQDLQNQKNMWRNPRQKYFRDFVDNRSKVHFNNYAGRKPRYWDC